MSKYRVPLAHPRPDIDAFMRAMRGEVVPQKPPMVEYLIDNALMKPIVQDLLKRKWVDTSDYTEYMGGQMDLSGENRQRVDAWLENQISFWHHMGYDFVRVEVSLPLPAVAHLVKDTARGNEEHTRAWQGLGTGPIQTWKTSNATRGRPSRTTTSTFIATSAPTCPTGSASSPATREGCTSMFHG